MGVKVLAGKGYGSIGHLPGGRLGPGDHHINAGQARICTVKARDKHDRILVSEKLDGSNVGFACLEDGSYAAINRAGYDAASSPWLQHRLFARWCYSGDNLQAFLWILRPGERLMGEWLAQVHSTRYRLTHVPFVAIDLMMGDKRLPYDKFIKRVDGLFPTPHLLHDGGPFSIEQAQEALGTHGHHGAIDPVEGAVWRVERKNEVDYLAKWVRPDKVAGAFVPKEPGDEPVWNWRPAARRG